jgi:hypothetical protein
VVDDGARLLPPVLEQRVEVAADAALEASRIRRRRRDTAADLAALDLD